MLIFKSDVNNLLIHKLFESSESPESSVNLTLPSVQFLIIN